VCTLSVSPRAVGLFTQSITESGPCVGLWAPLNVSWGRAVRGRLLASLNVSSVQELRGVSASNISWPSPDVDEILFNAYFVDGEGGVSPTPPIDRFVSGHINPSRWILGANSMDGVIPFEYDCDGCSAPKTASDWPNDLRLHWGDSLGAKVEAQYALKRFAGAAASAFVRADADGTVVCASYVQAKLASRANTTAFAYLFDYAKGSVRGCDVSADVNDTMHSSVAPHNCTNDALCGEVGWASHASELPFVWGAFDCDVACVRACMRPCVM
jgi:carboxylesterase type B